jgi:hypothetical protein
VQAVLGGRAGDVVSVLWEYRRCSSEEYAVITNGDAITCKPCPLGGDCAPASPSDIVELQDVVSQRGWWASSGSNGKTFYKCPIASACQPGSRTPGNDTGNSTFARTACAEGYGGVLCSTCALGYFPQYGTCTVCPAKESSVSLLASVTLPVVMVVVFGLMFFIRSLAPRGMVKVGVTMAQIVASANSAYNIPWPSSFASLLDVLKLFLIDVISLTKADCASPVMFYKTLLITLLGFKGILALAVVASYTLQRLRNNRASTGRWCGTACDVLSRRHGGQLSQSRAPKFSLAWTPVLRGSRRSVNTPSAWESVSMPPAASDAVVTATARGAGDAAAVPEAATRGVSRSSIIVAAGTIGRVRWSSLFRALFMILFIAYPSVSQKILRTFRCRLVEGRYYLAADMRLQCYTREWYGYALYAGIMGALYVVGLPLSIAIILVKRRRMLFGDGSAETRRVYGFLYEAYGPVAWWWEVEELLRKLFLTALVVLMDPGSPLQVTLAVLVSGWAHVLHAIYKPWRLSTKSSHNVTYMVQHASLFVTSFVFLMGLLFKMEGVSSNSPVYESLSVVMLLLCIAFVVWWSFEMFSAVAAKCCNRLRRRSGAAHATPPLTSQVSDGGLGRGDGSDSSDAVKAVPPVDGTVEAVDGSRARTELSDGVAVLRNKASTSAVVTNPMHVRRGGSGHDGGGAGGPGAPDRGTGGGGGGDSDVQALSVYFQSHQRAAATVKPRAAITSAVAPGSASESGTSLARGDT